MMSVDMWNDSPDPPASGPGVDLRARYGGMEPLAVRIRDNLPGPCVGANYAVGIGAAVTGLPRFDSATSAVIQVQTSAIRFTVDGAQPAAGLGHRADPGATITLTSYADLHSFLAIREGATDANLAVTYYG